MCTLSVFVCVPYLALTRKLKLAERRYAVNAVRWLSWTAWAGILEDEEAL